ncbi:unnamed protein product [Malus baccata var. baccata]
MSTNSFAQFAVLASPKPPIVRVQKMEKRNFFSPVAAISLMGVESKHHVTSLVSAEVPTAIYGISPYFSSFRQLEGDVAIKCSDVENVNKFKPKSA